MGYSNFRKIQNVTKKFGLSARRKELFESLVPVEPSPWLTETIHKSRLVPLNNEKTKAERIVSPVLVEVAEYYQKKITLFSGEALEVSLKDDLSGECDFFFTSVPQSAYLESPIISITESKDEDMEWGTAQCAAQLYGARLFNEAEGKIIPVLYGCATDGVEWQFLKFEQNLFSIDNKIYTDLKEILGVWHHIIRVYLD
jgi:hypothetical protein